MATDTKLTHRPVNFGKYPEPLLAITEHSVAAMV